MNDDAVTDLTRGVYRRLYSGFTKGQRINKLTLQAEAWFWRVLATVDDFGNGDADPELCHAMTAGRRKVTPKQISGWLREMKDAGLIEFYQAKGEPHLHVIGFEASQPAGKNGKRMKRYPFPGESGGIQMNPELSSSAPASEHTNDNKDNNHTESLSSTAAQVTAIFDFWKEHLKHPKAKLDAKRERVIRARLAAGFSVDDLCAAVRGCAMTPYNMGENEQRQVYDDIELICRDAKHVERFIDQLSNGNGAASRPIFMAAAK